MKKHLLFSLVIAAICFMPKAYSQTNAVKKINKNHFDEKAAIEEAKAKGIKPSEINGYVQFLKNDFSSKKALAKQVHKHSPYEAGATEIQETVIYLEPNKPLSLGCPNMGFEQYNFNGWTGGIGNTTTGTNLPNYTSTGTTIVNTAGNNTSAFNTTNYHTIMTLPPISNVFPNVPSQGYDTNAAKLINGVLYSQIPTRSPYSFDPVSVRMNGAVANSRACRLKYITTSSSTNQRLSFSYAVVLQNPSGHTAGESPYFKVEVKNETTGAILPGCTSYTFNPKSTVASDSLFQSDVGSTFDPTFYRKWQYYSVDLSSLPPGTNVSINFEVGGCSLSGHWGYAYVDAECGGVGTPYANMCSGSTFATLVAPSGFNTYQWYDPSGVLIPGATNDTLIQASAVPNTTYSVCMVSPGGCAICQTVTINFTTVNIINLNSTSSCAGGASGTANVQASGSNGIYTYTWTAVPSGSVVGTSQTVTGLAPGTYSVLVASTTCGQASANLSVGVSPPFFISLSKAFCGNSTSIAQPNGSNYTWYNGSTIVPGPAGTNDTLYIAPAVAGDKYTVVYDNAQGCRDSIVYTLNQVTGGTSYFSNTTNVCPSDSNGTTIINLNTPFAAPYSFVVTGPSSATTVTNTSTTSSSLTLTGLAPGTYTAIITDGVCIYNNTVTIGVIATNFTMTPTNTVLCFPQEVVVNMNFGETAPSSCGLSSSSSCSSPNIIQVGNATTDGSNNNYSPYGGLWESQKNQFLFRASELLAAGITPGKISSLALNVTNTNGNATSFANFTIKLKCVSYNVLSTTTMDNTGLVQVFNPTTINATTGWNTYNFAQAYDWDGTSNLLVDICFFNPNWDGNLSVQYSNPGYVASKYINTDGIDQCPLTAVDGSGNERPNIRFGNCGASNPASYTVQVSSNGTITANYTNDSIRIAPSFTIPPTGTGIVIYTVSVTNPVGNCVTSQTLAILYPPLTTTVTAIPLTFTLCEGGNTSFSANGAANYNWYYNQAGTLMPISTASVINVTPPAVGTNSYIVIGTPICPSGISDTAIVTVDVTPLANLLITPLSDVTKCLNKEYVLNTAVGSVPTNTAAIYSYSWTTYPGGTPAPGTNSSNTYTTNSNSTTTLVVSVSAACSNPTSDTVVVRNYADDLGISVVNTATLCPNSPFVLNTSTTGGHAAYAYYWTVGTNTISNTSSLSNNSPASGGTYNYNITVIDSCGYQKSSIGTINVLPNTLNVSIIDSSSACGGTPLALNSQAFNGYPNYSYAWSMGFATLSLTQALSSTNPTSEGTYTIMVTATDSCGYQATDYQLITVLPPCSIEIPNIITPNGDNANDFFKIKNIEYHPNTSLTIFDRWGKKVYENQNYNNEWKGEGVSDGTFFYIVDVPDDKKYNGFITVFKN
ncbi:MAG: gliding motility-associated C-terminal domain-containing protein [Bacteroidia bacterium]|nr:gliding motility-associated C-terminal domain-containing protein [Bacteroidia bacterium]